MGKDEGGAAMERGTELSGCIVMIPALDPGPDLAAYAAALLARAWAELAAGFRNRRQSRVLTDRRVQK